jgi:hypothetical protein
MKKTYSIVINFSMDNKYVADYTPGMHSIATEARFHGFRFNFYIESDTPVYFMEGNNLKELLAFVVTLKKKNEAYNKRNKTVTIFEPDFNSINILEHPAFCFFEL